MQCPAPNMIALLLLYAFSRPILILFTLIHYDSASSFYPTPKEINPKHFDSLRSGLAILLFPLSGLRSQQIHLD